MLDDELKLIIEGKNIKCFWELLDYLILCGYSQMDSLAICLNYYTEYDIWKDVAYAKLTKKEVERKNYTIGHDPINGGEYQRNSTGQITNIVHVVDNIEVVVVLEVGIIDGDNKHLVGLFDFYKKSIVEGKLDFNNHLIKEVEDKCKVIYNFTELIEFLLSYLQDTGKKHFGYDILNRTIKVERLNGEIGSEGNIVSMYPRA